MKFAQFMPPNCKESLGFYFWVGVNLCVDLDTMSDKNVIPSYTYLEAVYHNFIDNSISSLQNIPIKLYYIG